MKLWTAPLRHVAALVATLLLAASLPTCSPPAGPQSLRISGSNTVFPFATALAVGFVAANPGVTMRITADGTARGIKWAGEGEVSGLADPLASRALSIPDGNAGPTANGEVMDIGISSRNLLNEEREAYTTMQTTTFAFDSIGVATHIGVTGVTSLTRMILRDIYAGRTTNWMSLGGPNLPIVVIARDMVSGTAGAWQSLVMGPDMVVASMRVSQDIDVPRVIESTPGSIGYLSSGLLDPARMHTISVDGVAPTLANLRDGSYPLQRPFLFVTGSTPTPLQQRFIDFALGPAGAGIIQRAGALPGGR